MTYHPSLHDYMENIHGKEIPLQYVTVKVGSDRRTDERTCGMAYDYNPSQRSYQIHRK